jgi:hypothetical protein
MFSVGDLVGYTSLNGKSHEGVLIRVGLSISVVEVTKVDGSLIARPYKRYDLNKKLTLIKPCNTGNTMFKKDEYVEFSDISDPSKRIIGTVRQDQTDTWLYADSGIPPNVTHHAIDTSKEVVSRSSLQSLVNSTVLGSCLASRLDKLEKDNAPKNSTDGGNCSKCGLFNEYQSGAYLCSGCKLWEGIN